MIVQYQSTRYCFLGIYLILGRWDSYQFLYENWPVYIYLILLILWIVVFAQEALRALWQVAFPEEELRGLISEQWKEMGWQGKDPSSDFR